MKIILANPFFVLSALLLFVGIGFYGAIAISEYITEKICAKFLIPGSFVYCMLITIQLSAWLIVGGLFYK